MPSLMAILGADASPMARELRAVQKLAGQTGATLKTNLGGHAFGSINSGWTQIIHSVRATFDSIASGAPPMRVMAQQIPQVAQGLLLMGKNVPFLSLLVRHEENAATGAIALADAWSAQAAKAGLAAVASTQKAAASTAALYAEGGETEATLAAAVADEQKAAADVLTAQATQAKALASGEAAAAAAREAGATRLAIGPLGIVIGAAVAIGAGFFAAWKLAGALADRLSNLKPPDFHPEYIASHLKASNAVAESWKNIRREVEHAVTAYNSAEKAAARVADTTKTHFDHQKRMTEYAKETELARARSATQRHAIEAKYAAEELKQNAAQRNVELGNKINEQASLTIEAKQAKQKADAIKVGSKEHDANLTAQRKQEADEAQKYLETVAAAKGGMKEKILRGYNAVALSGVSGGDLNAAEKANKMEATRRIQAYRDQVNAAAGNDEARTKRDELNKRAGESFGKAAALALEIETQKRINAIKSSNEAEETAARLAADRAKAMKAELVHPNLSNLQKIGTYTAPGMVSLVDVAKKSEHHLAAIHGQLSKMGGSAPASRLGRGNY